MLKRILVHVMRILRAILSAPARMLGLAGPPAPPSHEYENVVDEQVEELRDELGAAPEAPAHSLQTLGERVHEYASRDRQARGTYDLAGMPEHVAIALCTMPPEQLGRLALAGPAICEGWADGMKTGLVGVPLPRTDWAPVTPPEPAANEIALVPEGEAPGRGRGWRLAG